MPPTQQHHSTLLAAPAAGSLHQVHAPAPEGGGALTAPHGSCCKADAPMLCALWHAAEAASLGHHTVQMKQFMTPGCVWTAFLLQVDMAMAAMGKHTQSQPCSPAVARPPTAAPLTLMLHLSVRIVKGTGQESHG